MAGAVSVQVQIIRVQTLVLRNKNLFSLLGDQACKCQLQRTTRHKNEVFTLYIDHILILNHQILSHVLLKYMSPDDRQSVTKHFVLLQY
jgi:hypothetical protein